MGMIVESFEFGLLSENANLKFNIIKLKNKQKNF